LDTSFKWGNTSLPIRIACRTLCRQRRLYKRFSNFSLRAVVMPVTGEYLRDLLINELHSQAVCPEKIVHLTFRQGGNQAKKAVGLTYVADLNVRLLGFEV
jgi:hypothetical protein